MENKINYATYSKKVHYWCLINKSISAIESRGPLDSWLELILGHIWICQSYNLSLVGLGASPFKGTMITTALISAICHLTRFWGFFLVGGDNFSHFSLISNKKAAVGMTCTFKEDLIIFSMYIQKVLDCFCKVKSHLKSNSEAIFVSLIIRTQEN